MDSISFPDLNPYGPSFPLSGILFPSLTLPPQTINQEGGCHTPFSAPKRTGPRQGSLVKREKMGEEEPLVSDSALVSAIPTPGVPRQFPSPTLTSKDSGPFPLPSAQ